MLVFFFVFFFLFFAVVVAIFKRNTCATNEVGGSGPRETPRGGSAVTNTVEGGAVTPTHRYTPLPTGTHTHTQGRRTLRKEYTERRPALPINHAAESTAASSTAAFQANKCLTMRFSFVIGLGITFACLPAYRFYDYDYYYFFF